MVNSDILIEDDQIKAIRRFLVSVGADDSPNVEFRPELATLNLGGGAGEQSDGDVEIEDADGNVRVHHSAGGEDASPETTRAYVNGETGAFLLGAENVENEDVAIRPKWAALSLGGGGGSNSDGDVKLKDRNGKTALQLDGGGNGVADQSTNVYVDADTGSIHARPKPIDDDASFTHPLLYIYNHWEEDGQNWKDYEEFPTERPVIAKSQDDKQTGLVWENDGDKFVFQGVYMEDSDLGLGAPSIPSVDRKQALTVDIPDERVGIGTDSPEHSLHVAGNVKATNVEVPSDARYKTNVESIDGPSALDAVQSLSGVKFEWNDDAPHAGATDDGRQLGFVAQEVEDVLPESVSRNEDGYRSMTQGAVTPVLVEAVKDQQEQLDRQKSVIDEQRDVVDEQQEVIEDQRETIERQREALADLEARVEALERDGESGGNAEE